MRAPVVAELASAELTSASLRSAMVEGRSAVVLVVRNGDAVAQLVHLIPSPEELAGSPDGNSSRPKQ